jgi:cell division protein FtsN
MKNLLSIASTLILGSALALGGCTKDKKDAKADPAAEPAKTEAAKPEPAKADPPKADPPAAPAAAADPAPAAAAPAAAAADDKPKADGDKPKDKGGW